MEKKVKQIINPIVNVGAAHLCEGNAAVDVAQPGMVLLAEQMNLPHRTHAVITLLRLLSVVFTLYAIPSL